MKAIVTAATLGVSLVCWTLVERGLAGEPLKTPIQDGGSRATPPLETAPDSDSSAMPRVAREDGRLEAPASAYHHGKKRVVSRDPGETRDITVIRKAGAHRAESRLLSCGEPRGVEIGDNGREAALGVCSGTYAYGQNASNVTIPDYGNWVASVISISDAPAGATVTCIDVHYEIIHDWVENLDVDLNDADLTYNYDLWGPGQGWGRDLDETVTGITTFNGERVSQPWLLYVRDTLPGDTGYIDYWWIKVYYEGCNPICGDGVCECECEETIASCPGDCVDAPCAAEDPVPVCAGDTYEMCVRTFVFCPCEEPPCDWCWDGGCDPRWNGDDECDCGCQFCDIDCPEYPDCCIAGPADAYVYTGVFPSACGSMNPAEGWSEWDPTVGEYIFCSDYTAGTCEGDVCARLWIDGDGPCDPEAWWRFEQNDPSRTCGDGTCQPACGEDCTTCEEDCGCGSCEECIDGTCHPCCGNWDMDEDGDVDLYDFAVWQQCLGVSPVAPSCTAGDLDCDHIIDLNDYSAFPSVVTGPE